MKSNLITLALLSGAMAMNAQSTMPAVVWSTGGNLGSGPDARYVQRFVIKNIGDDIAGMAFNQFARRMNMLNEADTIRELVPGYYYVASPRFGEKSDSLVIEINTKAHLVNGCYAPDGVHLVKKDGTTVPVDYTRSRLTRPEQWIRQGKDPMPYGDIVFALNDSRKTDWTPGVYDIIPSFKKVTLLKKGETPDLDIPTDRPGLVKILVRDGRPMFYGANGTNLTAARNVYDAKIGQVTNKTELPDAVLEFEPDMEWRGLMIDVARNYQQPETIKDILGLMADNGLNKLHFHLVDDEAWRLDIAPLPELTAVGSRRGWGTDESDHLYQIFTGDGNPDNYTNTSNGHLTREQFKDILTFAYELGIDVIPEIESPGHARAAIRAMEVRAKNGDPSYRLIHDGDTSVYTGAQSFHDNVMNPALPGPYKFMETVIDDIIAMYKEADVPLKGIHIGGDEVPKGAWNGSGAARKFMEENKLADQHAFHAHFVTEVARMLAERGVPMHGWQEVALGHSDKYDKQIAPVTGGINCWSTIIKKGDKPVPLRAVEGGYPVILSNVDHFYFDLAYSPHPEEKGLNWGGYVDEFAAFNGYPAQLCPTDGTEKGRVIGVNAHVFAETMRSGDQLKTYLTPKIFGLAERAFNNDSTYTEAQFNRLVGDRELPRLEKNSQPVHMRQPGIIVTDGMIVMNAPYDGGTIRYTVDGTEPTAESPVYTGPMAINGATDIRARYFRNGAESVTTYLFVNE